MQPRIPASSTHTPPADKKGVKILELSAMALQLFYVDHKYAESIKFCSEAITLAEESPQHHHYRSNLYWNRAITYNSMALLASSSPELRQQYLACIKADTARCLELDPSKASAIKKIEFMQKIFEEFSYYKWQHHLIRTQLLKPTEPSCFGQNESKSAELLYQLEKRKEAKLPISTAEILDIKDKAFSLIPYHTGLLKSCIELTKQLQAESKEPEKFNAKLEKYYLHCNQLNVALSNDHPAKEIKEEKKPEHFSLPAAAQSNKKTIKNKKKKKRKQEKAREEEKRIADEKTAAIQKRDKAIAAWIKSVEKAQQIAAEKQKNSVLAQQRAMQAQQRAEQAQLRAREAQKNDGSAKENFARAQAKANESLNRIENVRIQAERTLLQKKQTLAQLATLKMELLTKQLELPAVLVATRDHLQKFGVRAHICGDQLRQAVCRAEGLPLIQGEMDSKLLVGLNTNSLKEIRSFLAKSFPGAHIILIPGDNKDRYTFKIKFPLKKVFNRFIYDDLRTIDVRVSKALSNFEISEEEALRNHARTCDFTQDALFYNGKLFDGAREIGISSAIKDIENGVLTAIKSYQEYALLPFRLIYKYGRNEGNISAADIEIIQSLQPEYLATLEPGVINHWLKKILCHGHAVINLLMLQKTRLLNKLFPSLPFNDPAVINELARAAINADQYYTECKVPADFDEIYARLIMKLADITKINSDIIKNENRLFDCNFKIYRNDLSLCLRKLQHYKDKALQVPSLIKEEIVCNVNQSIINTFILGSSEKNINQPHVINFLKSAFKDLTKLLLENPKIKKLVLRQLEKLNTSPCMHNLSHLYAFWIVVISNVSLPAKSLDTVKNTNLFFQMMFPESVEIYADYFDKAKLVFADLAMKLGGIPIPASDLEKFADKLSTTANLILILPGEEKARVSPVLQQVTASEPRSFAPIAPIHAPPTATAPMTPTQSLGELDSDIPDAAPLPVLTAIHSSHVVSRP